jgi:hypothetical protein
MQNSAQRRVETERIVSDEKKTLRLNQRLVSFDGGAHYKPGFAVSDAELGRHWDALYAAMEPRTRAQVEKMPGIENRKAFLAYYLALADSHLVLPG